MKHLNKKVNYDDMTIEAFLNEYCGGCTCNCGCESTPGSQTLGAHYSIQGYGYASSGNVAYFWMHGTDYC